MKGKRKLNRLLSAILIVMLVTTTVAYTTYKTPEKVKAVALVDDGLFILMILGVLGISYIGAQVESTPPIDIGKLTGDAQRDLENAGLGITFDEYQEKMYEDYGVPNPNDDFDPDNDDPNDKVPKWDKLKEWCKKHGNKLKITAGGALATVLGKTGYDLYQKQQQGDYSGILQDVMSQPGFPIDNMIKHLSDYPYYSFMYRTYDDGSMDIYYLDLYDNYPYFYKTPGGGINACNRGKMLRHSNKPIVDKEWLNYTFDNSSVNSGGYEFTTNLKIYDNQADAKNAMDNNEQSKDYPSTINPKSLPFSTDAMDFIKSNPNADTLPVAENTRYPTENELSKFLDGIRNPDIPGNPQPTIDDFINAITKPPATDPDEPVNPTPPVTPTVTPDPDITETPEPDLDITDEAKKKFLLPESIKNKFPFCIPFDLIDSFTVLKSTGRTAPKIDLPLKSERYGIDYTMSIDMAVYDKQAELLRTLELLIFVVSLIIATRSLIRG